MAINSQIGLRQFRFGGCLSYFFFDPKSRLAAIIDPVAELMEDYRVFIAENGIKPVIVLDTHIHADHFSATHLFRAEFDVAIGMSARTLSSRVTRKLKAGDRVEIGSLGLEVLETPGHTSDSLCFYGHGMVFTGDTLLIGASGRTDFTGSDPKDQWRSLHEILGKLPDATLVYSGHDYSEMLFSTIGTEKAQNEHWRMPTVDAYVTLKMAEHMPSPNGEISKRIAFNVAAMPEGVPLTLPENTLNCGSGPLEVERIAVINVEKFHHKLKKPEPGMLYIDVREPAEYRDGHIKGSVNIPLSELGLHLEELRKARRIYLSCLSGRRSAMAVRTLSYMGLSDVVNVNGGIKAWLGAGFEVGGISNG